MDNLAHDIKMGMMDAFDQFETDFGGKGEGMSKFRMAMFNLAVVAALFVFLLTDTSTNFIASVLKVDRNSGMVTIGKLVTFIGIYWLATFVTEKFA